MKANNKIILHIICKLHRTPCQAANFVFSVHCSHITNLWRLSYITLSLTHSFLSHSHCFSRVYCACLVSSRLGFSSKNMNMNAFDFSGGWCCYTFLRVSVFFFVLIFLCIVLMTIVLSIVIKNSAYSQLRRRVMYNYVVNVMHISTFNHNHVKTIVIDFRIRIISFHTDYVILKLKRESFARSFIWRIIIIIIIKADIWCSIYYKVK